MHHLFLIVLTFLNASCALQSARMEKNPTIKGLIEKNEPVFVQNQTFDDAIDFTQFLEATLMSQGQAQVHIQSPITFVNCTFKQPVSAYRKEGEMLLSTTFHGNLSFLECQFEAEVNFRACTVIGRTDFTKCTFKQTAVFEETTFLQNAYFHGCMFNGEHRFQNSFFNQKANFMNSEFNGLASFQSTVFNSELQMSVAKFYKYADFSLMDCRGAALFAYAEFADQAVFNGAHFHNRLDFISVQNDRTDFSKARFLGETRFNKSTAQQSVKLSQAFFLMGEPDFDSLREKVLMN